MVFLAIAEELIAGRVGLVAIPAEFHDRRVHGVTVLLELLLKLLELVDLFLLFGCDLGRGLGIDPYGLRSRNRPGYDEDCSPD